ncbi:MAG: 2Fe-2S iron-sulfur cluster-binding protein [Lacisediminimonas sp.]|nr:2Fe-2S iron-sulfur cluster-binding protein [Lacisediminimonas sp.]MDO8300064.1 2Fe-2S iron-sulfur cluster-binding protein [Lacisediminimonas sp.]
MSNNLVKVTLKVNGTVQSRQVEARTTLVDFLRDHLLLTGTHVGCEHGICGACSVLLNGEPVRSCCTFAVQVDGMEITTVEGLAPERGQMSKIQDAFCEKHAMQCGY